MFNDISIAMAVALEIRGHEQRHTFLLLTSKDEEQQLQSEEETGVLNAGRV